jgi:hypothetical protein
MGHLDEEGESVEGLRASKIVDEGRYVQYTNTNNPVSYSSFPHLSPLWTGTGFSFPFETNSTPRVTQLSSSCRSYYGKDSSATSEHLVGDRGSEG